MVSLFLISNLNTQIGNLGNYCNFVGLEILMFYLTFFFFFCFQKGGGTIDLEPCLTHTSTVEPTLAPVAVERTMTTRAAASVLPDSFSSTNFLDLCS